MILIYTHHISTRLKYTVDLIFRSVLNSKYELTENKDVYEKSTLPKLVYTFQQENFETFMQSHSLLFDQDIRKEVKPLNTNGKGIPVFITDNASSFLAYDIFATVFYFASRYEEYHLTDKDAHERFKAGSSLAFQHNCLQKPFLNELIHEFSEKLKAKFPQLTFKKNNFRFLSTVDIDNAFAYAHKGLKRNIGGLLKDLSQFKFSNIVDRINSNRDPKKDPYNNFDLIHSLSEKTKTDLLYFVLIGNYSQYDKNPDYHNEGFRTFLKQLSTQHAMGLHPSYESYNHIEKIELEKKRLEEIIEKKITAARCHFLRIKLPDTYREFIRLGITDDYTMIYAAQSGFRTGLCVPYKWFDLEKNEQTNLTIHTSTVMEGTLRDYNKLDPRQASLKIDQLFNEVKKYEGEFISIWHNDSFTKSQTKWINIYVHLLEKNNS